MEKGDERFLLYYFIDDKQIMVLKLDNNDCTIHFEKKLYFLEIKTTDEKGQPKVDKIQIELDNIEVNKQITINN